MDEKLLAGKLYEFELSSAEDSRKPDAEEIQIWEEFLEELQQVVRDVSGCEAEVLPFFQSRQYETACGYHRDYGYFYVSCGDRDDRYLVISEPEKDFARNYFLRLFFDRTAYELAVKRRGEEEKRWSCHCRFDYRVAWFKTALDWLAPAVDWMFFTECVDWYMALLNRWFSRQHWGYDYERARITEVSDSKEYSDPEYLYSISYDGAEDISVISLTPQFDAGGSEERKPHVFSVKGQALEMARTGDTVYILLDGKEDNIEAYTWDGNFLWNIGSRRYRRHYDEIDREMLQSL